MTTGVKDVRQKTAPAGLQGLEPQDALVASELRYRTLVEMAPDGIAVSVDGRWALANDAAARLLGLERGTELVGREAMEFIPLDERAGAAERMRAVIEGRKHFPLALRRMIRADGAQVEVELAGAPVVIDGRPGVQVVLRDLALRRAATEALERSDLRFRSLVETMNEGVLVTGRGDRIEFVNKRLCEMLGYTQARLVGSTFLETLVDPADQPFIQARQQNRRRGISERYETALIASSGARVPVLISASPLPLEGGAAVPGALAIVTDLTEQKLAEEARRRSEELYRAMVEATPNLIVAFDLEGRVTSANANYCAVVGLSLPELLGRREAELGFSEADIREFEAFRQRVAACDAAMQSEVTLTLPTGASRAFEYVLTPLHDGEGAINGFSMVATDVTDRRREREVKDGLLSAVEQAADVIFMTDRDGTITYVNPAFEKIYGFAPEEAIGQSPRILKGGATPSSFYERLWRSISAGEVFRGEIANRAKDGRLVTVETSITPVVGPAGEISGFIAVQNDISERKAFAIEQKRLEERLIQMAKMEAIGTLAAGIAHDFNNILAIVLSFTTIAEKTKDRETFGRAIQTIRQAVARGGALARQVLTFARRTEKKVEPVDLEHVVHELVSMAQGTFPKTVAIHTEIDPDLPLIEADPGQLHQALLNLLVNARNAMAGGGTITVSAHGVDSSEVRSRFPDAPARRFVRLRCADSGAGMTPEVKARIFEPFFTTKEDGQGTGLGLAVLYGVVEAHAGYIRVESEEGSGSTFEIFLPAMELADVGVAARPDVTPSRGTGTLLVVEDEQPLAMFLASMLEENGYRVVTAADGTEAISIFDAHPEAIDAVVTDAGLPGRTGADVFLHIRARRPEVPVILASGYVEPEVLADLRRRGLSRFLQKPYTAEELLDALGGSFAEKTPPVRP